MEHFTRNLKESVDFASKATSNQMSEGKHLDDVMLANLRQKMDFFAFNIPFYLQADQIMDQVTFPTQSKVTVTPILNNKYNNSQKDYPVRYKVKPGDTLAKISREVTDGQVSVDDILYYNRNTISSKDLICTAQEIWLYDIEGFGRRFDPSNYGNLHTDFSNKKHLGYEVEIFLEFERQDLFLDQMVKSSSFAKTDNTYVHNPKAEYYRWEEEQKYGRYIKDEASTQGVSVPSWMGWSNNTATTAAYGATQAGGSMRLTKGGSLSLKYYVSAWTGGSKARITTYNLSKLGTGIGYGTSFLGAGIGAVNFALSDKSWGDYGALGISLLSSGLTLSGVTAPIGIGIGFIEVMGGFNGFYEGLDANQQLYNITGGVISPINGIPIYIQLKK